MILFQVTRRQSRMLIVCGLALSTMAVQSIALPTTADAGFLARIFGRDKNPLNDLDSTYKKALQEEEKALKALQENDLKAVRAEKRGAKSEVVRLQKQRDQIQADLERAQEALGKSQSELQKYEAEARALETKINNDGARVEQLTGHVAQLTKAKSYTDARKSLDEMERLDGEVSNARSSQAEAGQKIAEARDAYNREASTAELAGQQLNATSSSLSENQARLAELKGKIAEIKARDPEAEAAAKSELLRTGALQKVLNDWKGQQIDAKLLTTRMDVLAEKHQLNQAQLGILSDSLNLRIQQTLLGQYVNDQIKKTLGNLCSLKAACEGNPAGLQNQIDELLKSPSVGSAAEKAAGYASQKQGGAPAPAAPKTAAAAPAKAQSAN
jgi:chromosome segregation ATPase